MRESKWLWMTILGPGLFALALILNSCGGGGGPVNPPDQGAGPSAEFLALLPEGQQGAEYIGASACADCHGGKAEDPVYKTWLETEHGKKGVGCEQCHGPGSKHRDAAADDKKNTILTFPKVVSPVTCAQCHGPIYENWRFSAHSKLIARPVEEAAVDPNRYGRSSRCVSCHSGLWRVEVDEAGKDPATMTDEEIAEVAENTIQHARWTASCVVCHNPHAKTGNLTDDGKEVQLRHTVYNTDTTDVAPGTTAAQFTRYNHQCAECHNGRGTDPSDSRLNSSTSRPSMHDSPQFNMLMGIGGVEGSGPIQRFTAHAEAAGQCSHCHMPNSRHSFSVSYDAGCAPCHTATDAAARVATTKSEIQAALYALRTRLEGWAEATFEDPDLWDYTSLIAEEGKTPPDQSLVPIQIKRARHNYYFILRDGCYGPHNAPYARHLLTIANENMDELGGSAPKRGRQLKQPNLSEIAQILESDRQRAKRADRGAE